jgi:hypothetical protein
VDIIFRPEVVALLTGITAAAAALSGILIRGVVDSRLTRIQLRQQAEVANLQSDTQMEIAQAQERRQADQLRLQWQLFNAQKVEERVARLADEKRNLYGQFLLTARSAEHTRWMWKNYEQELPKMGLSVALGTLYPGQMPEVEGLGKSEIRPTIAVYKDELPVDTESALAHGQDPSRLAQISASSQGWVDEARGSYKSYIYQVGELGELRAAMDLLVPQDVRDATSAIIHSDSHNSLNDFINNFLFAARKDLGVDNEESLE